jgi:hypothetical protein
MSYVPKANDDASKNRSYYQDCFLSNTLGTIRPSVTSETVFRPIPEVDAAGNILPMIKATTVSGNDYSNLCVEEVVLGACREDRFNGLCRASDSDATDAINMVFPSLFIKLRGREKKGELPSSIKDDVTALLAEREVQGAKIKQRYMPRSSAVGFLQGVALKVNGKALDAPAKRQVLVLPTSLLTALDYLLTDAHKKGIDVFSPTSGYAIVVKGLAPDRSVGRTVSVFTAELGPQMTISEESARKLWVPWEQALKLHTTDQLITRACRCFGRNVVEFIYPDEVARLFPSAPLPAARPAVAARPPAPALAPAQARPAIPASASVLAVDDSDGTVLIDDQGDDLISAGAPKVGVSPASADDLAAQYSSLLKSI